MVVPDEEGRRQATEHGVLSWYMLYVVVEDFLSRCSCSPRGDMSSPFCCSSSRVPGAKKQKDCN